MRSRTLSVALLILCTVNAIAQATADRWVGTWKLNTTKSKYESGTLPKNRTLVFEAVAGGVKATSDLLDDVGIVHVEFTVKYGGPDAPLRGSVTGATISMTRVDATTFDTVQKNAGKVSATTHYVVSRDGRTLTATATGTDPEGKKFNNISVYDKQP